jgi:hypothetical protein
MYVRWQARKRQQPDVGYSHGVLRDEDGVPVWNQRGSPLRTRQRADGSVGQDVRWNAVLVEAVRVGGKPRQRHIANIGSITESCIAVDTQRRYFWDGVHERLDRLVNRISIEDRRRIEEAIALKVPRLTLEEHDASVEKASGYCVEGYEPKPYRVPT